MTREAELCRLIGPAEQVGRAEITRTSRNGSGIFLRASGWYPPGIGRVGFVLIDLGAKLTASVVDRKDVDYSGSLPERVSEEWRSAQLEPGTAYRAFFHVYDRTGVNLVAYDRRDFIAGEENHGKEWR